MVSMRLQLGVLVGVLLAPLVWEHLALLRGMQSHYRAAEEPGQLALPPEELPDIIKAPLSDHTVAAVRAVSSNGTAHFTSPSLVGFPGFFAY